MRNQPVLILLSFIWLLFIQDLFAQANFSLPVLNNMRPGAGVDVPVTVRNFKGVVSMQFVIRWDPKVLRFEQVINPQLPSLDVKSSFGTTNALDSGMIRVSWLSLIAPTVPDNTPIFTLRFSVIGGANSSSLITFGEQPPTTFFEMVMQDRRTFNFQQIAPYLRNGAVAIGFTLPTTATTAWAPRITATPNPFRTHTLIEFSEATSVPFMALHILDGAGKVCASRKISATEQQNGIVIDNTEFSQPGVYFLHLQSHTFSVIKPLIYF